MRHTWFQLFTELSSRPLIAKLAGAIAKSTASRRWIAAFITHYRIPADEAEFPLEQYESLNEFFTRKLRKGARPIDPEETSVISPVDGTVVESGQIEADQTFQVKGQMYSLSELLGHSPHTVRFTGGSFAVIYLSPSDYHRIHAPVAGNVIEFDRIAGKVYPVHDKGMRLMPKVLSRNVRLVTYLQRGKSTMALVKVGAMNVSSIRYAADDKPPEQVMKGEELAYFEFGSTVVLLWDRGSFAPGERLAPGQKVRMGEKIGELSPEPDGGSAPGMV